MGWGGSIGYQGVGGPVLDPVLELEFELEFKFPDPADRLDQRKQAGRSCFFQVVRGAIDCLDLDTVGLVMALD